MDATVAGHDGRVAHLNHIEEADAQANLVDDLVGVLFVELVGDGVHARLPKVGRLDADAVAQLGQDEHAGSPQLAASRGPGALPAVRQTSKVTNRGADGRGCRTAAAAAWPVLDDVINVWSVLEGSRIFEFRAKKRDCNIDRET